ncbi:hypothetical protein ABKV19_024003 [Rosa sericea]
MEREESIVNHHLTHPESLVTWEIIRARPNQGKVKKRGTTCDFYGPESPEYASLLPEGWLAEKRVMHHGRKYMYYYDPLGHQYTTKKEVKKAKQASRV